MVLSETRSSAVLVLGRHVGSGRTGIHRNRLSGDFYIEYRLYRNCWPLSALGRYARPM